MPGGEQEDRESAAAMYGWSLALIRSDPEVRKTFENARKKGYSPDRFVAELRDTKWFKTHSEAWRTNETLKITDPQTWKAKTAAVRATTRDNAAAMGAVLSDKQLDRVTENVMMFGWNDAQQRNALATYVGLASGGPLKGQYIGDAGKNASELRAAAVRNGYKIPKGKLSEWNKAIMAGNSSVEDYQGFIRRQAAAAFPTFAEELLAGADLEDLASPYKNRMAELLEIPEKEVTLFDPKIRKALAHKPDPKSGKVAAMPLWEFEDSLRNDERWQFTDNAHQEVLGQTLRLGQMFGVTG